MLVSVISLLELLTTVSLQSHPSLNYRAEQSRAELRLLWSVLVLLKVSALLCTSIKVEINGWLLTGIPS